MRLNFLRPAGSSWLCLLLFLMAGPSAVADSLLNGLIAPAADPAASRNSIGWQRPVNPNAATVAIMIVGKIDFHSADIAAGWKPWVVNPLAQHGHSSHAFICSHDYPKGGSDGAVRWWQQIFGGNMSSVTADEGKIESTAHAGQFLRLDACFDLVLAHEKTTLGFTFTHFLRGRPDLRWFYVPNFLLTPRFVFDPAQSQRFLDPEDDHYVYVRARSLYYSPPKKVPYDALTEPDRLCLDARTPMIRNEPNRTGAQKLKEQRNYMVDQDVSMCAGLDDQVAFVPRALGHAFYTTTQFEKTGDFVHPDEYTGIGDVNATYKTYGRSAWSFNYTSVCEHWNPHAPKTLYELYSKYHNKTVGVQRKFSSDTARCYAEGCLTARVVSRLVPFKVVPIPALIDKMYGNLKRKRQPPPKGSKETRHRVC